jgi:hypothetical protein
VDATNERDSRKNPSDDCSNKRSHVFPP